MGGVGEWGSGQGAGQRGSLEGLHGRVTNPCEKRMKPNPIGADDKLG